MIGLDAAHAVPLYDVYSQIVHSLTASDVQDTVIGGRIVMQNGRVLTLDGLAILARAQVLAAQVKRSLARPPNSRGNRPLVSTSWLPCAGGAFSPR